MKALNRSTGGIVVSLLLASLFSVRLEGVALAAAPDGSSSTADPDGVSDLIERGIALRRSGDDARALELFLQAEKLAPDSTRVQVHLAATYQALGQWERADHYLTEAIKDPDDAYIQKHQAVLAQARRTIDGHIGSLQLSGGPAGTEVRLNGRSVGKLPLEETLRVEAGIYTLEARLPGHYPVTRSVALAGGTLVRESLLLTPESANEPAPVAASPARPREADHGPRWLGWVFGGLAVGAGAATVVAWSAREQHVDNWNDDSRCLAPGQTRGEVCGNERRDGDRAETWMWVSGAATGALAAASVVTFWLTSEDEERVEAAGASGTQVGCGVGLGLLRCSGRF